MKEDEKELLTALQEQQYLHVRDVVSALGIPEKRAAYICDKWERKGWYDYGTNVLAGWLTAAGKLQDPSR